MTIGGGGGSGVAPKKKQRIGSSTHYPSSLGIIDGDTLADVPHKLSGALLRSASSSHFSTSSFSSSVPGVGGFNDSTTSDVVLRLYIEKSSFLCDDDSGSVLAVGQLDHQIYLHSQVLQRSKYFAALLSDRWRKGSDLNEVGNAPKIHYLNFGVPASYGSVDNHLTVLKLLYASDFSDVIDNASLALSLLPVALELLFEDCVTACVRFLEAVPWTEEEERKILRLVPFLSQEESQELLARLSPAKNDSSEEMLHELILSATHIRPTMAYAKAFVAKLLRDFSSKESARRVLGRAFELSLRIVKEAFDKYTSPDFRVDHNETEAIQRLNLHTAMTNGKHLLWLIERMIELKVADTAVMEWSNQDYFTSDLESTFCDDAWRNIVPGLPSVFLRCTCKLANAVATGNIVVSKQVRMKLVECWLPVLITCKDHISPSFSNHKPIYLELEETFLRVISTLPLPDAQKLLQRCLSFSTRNVEDCPHLVSAFTTWFKRANRPLQTDSTFSIE